MVGKCEVELLAVPCALNRNGEESTACHSGFRRTLMPWCLDYGAQHSHSQPQAVHEVTNESRFPFHSLHSPKLTLVKLGACGFLFHPIFLAIHLPPFKPHFLSRITGASFLLTFVSPQFIGQNCFDFVVLSSGSFCPTRRTRTPALDHPSILSFSTPFSISSTSNHDELLGGRYASGSRKWARKG